MTPTLATMAAALLGLLLSLALWRRDRRRRLGLRTLAPLAIGLGLGLRLLFALATPPGEAPDERAHFNYLRVMADTGALPLVAGRTGSVDQDWEHYQPPLYYLLLRPIHAVTSGSIDEATILKTLRFSSPLLWLVGALLLHGALLRLGREQGLSEFVQAWTLWLICLLPTFVFLGGALNYDYLLFALGALAIRLMLGESGPRRELLLGVILGLALQTKLTGLLILAAAGLLILARARLRPTSPRATLMSMMRVMLPALILWAPWLLRNLRLYDSLTAVELVNNPAGWSLGHGLKMTLSYMQYSFWAVAGAQNQLGFLVRLGLAVNLLAVMGLVLRLRHGTWPRGEAGALLTAALAAVSLNLLLLLAFGLSYAQGQGRFLYPLLMPLGILMGLGLEAYGPLVRRRNPGLLTFAFLSTWSLAFAANVLLRLRAAA